MSRLPAPHAPFPAAARPRLRADARLVGVAAGGSCLTGGLDHPAAGEAAPRYLAEIETRLGDAANPRQPLSGR